MTYIQEFVEYNHICEFSKNADAFWSTHIYLAKKPKRWLITFGLGIAPRANKSTRRHKPRTRYLVNECMHFFMLLNWVCYLVYIKYNTIWCIFHEEKYYLMVFAIAFELGVCGFASAVTVSRWIICCELKWTYSKDALGDAFPINDTIRSKNE